MEKCDRSVENNLQVASCLNQDDILEGNIKKMKMYIRGKVKLLSLMFFFITGIAYYC